MCHNKETQNYDKWFVTSLTEICETNNYINNVLMRRQCQNKPDVCSVMMFIYFYFIFIFFLYIFFKFYSPLSTIKIMSSAVNKPIPTVPGQAYTPYWFGVRLRLLGVGSGDRLFIYCFDTAEALDMMWYRPENTIIDRGDSRSQYWYSLVSSRYHTISNASIVNNYFII